MFGNKDLRPRTKHRHGKLSCHNGIWWDMEGMLQVWLINQVDRRYICVSNMVMHLEETFQTIFTFMLF